MDEHVIDNWDPLLDNFKELERKRNLRLQQEFQATCPHVDTTKIHTLGAPPMELCHECHLMMPLWGRGSRG